MKPCCLILLSLIINSVLSKQKKRKYHKENGIIILNDANFNSTTKRFKHLFVEFTANWCGRYCKDISNDVTKAALRLTKHKPKITFARINVDENSKTHSLVSIHQYPTLYYYEKGVQFNYTGVMSEVGIIKWAMKRVLPPLIEHNILSEISNFKNTHEISLIYFGTDTDVLTFLKEKAIQDQDMFYSYCSLSTALGQYSVKANSIIIFRDYGEERTELSGKLTSNGMDRFIERNGKNKILGFNDQTAQMIWQKHQPGMFILRDSKGHQAEAMNRIAKNVADQLYGDIKIVLAEIEKKDEPVMQEGLFVSPSDLPAVRIVDTRNNKRLVYIFEEIVTEEAILQFYDDWTKGKLHPHLKSEDIPKDQTGGVFKVVSKTYVNEVLNHHSNVLVLYYTPHINVCKEYIIVYEEFASIMNKDYKDVNLRIASIDIQKNELENFDDRDIPAVKLFIIDPTSNKDQVPKTIKQLKNKKNDLNELIGFVQDNLNINISKPQEETEASKEEDKEPKSATTEPNSKPNPNLEPINQDL